MVKQLRGQNQKSRLALPVLVVSIILIEVLLSGCSSTSTTTPPSNTVSSFTNSPTPPKMETTLAISSSTPTLNSISVTNTPSNSNSSTSADSAWGNTYKISSVLIGYEQNYHLGPITATPDARYLVGSLMPSVFGSGKGRFGLFDMTNRQFTTINNLPPRTQVVGAAADAKWIVWVEGSRQPDFGDWILYAYNRTDSTTKTIAKAPLGTDGQPLASSYVIPKMDNGIVIWEEATTKVANVIPITVKMADLNSGKITTLTEIGRSGAISYPYVLWSEATNELSPILEGAYKSLIILFNLQTGVKKTLKKPDTPSYYAIYKDTIVWITSEKIKKVILTNVDETYEQVIAQAKGEADVLQFPEISERLVVWSGMRSYQLWDRKQQRLISLEQERGFKFEVNGKAFIWIAGASDEEYIKDKIGAIGKQTIYLVDTTQLP
jgi:hypothetical protein